MGSLNQTVEALYTICPVFVASNVAVEKGWLQEEFEKAGISLKYLRSLPDNKGWLPHYQHSLPNLFRDGGAIPALTARSQGRETLLVGITALQRAGRIVVQSDSDIYRVEDLRGKRIGLFKSANSEKVDFARITQEQGIATLLRLYGISRSEIEFVDIVDEDRPKWKPAEKPSELWKQTREKGWFQDHSEIQALLDKHVDALYEPQGRLSRYEEEGLITTIADLSEFPDWRVQVSNSPYTITVSRELAESKPEAVVAFLRASLRAAAWIKNNRIEAGEIFAKVTHSPNGQWASTYLKGLDLEPGFSKKSLAALEIQKRFLLDFGYIEKDFDLQQWSAPRFLEEAAKSLS